MSWSGHSRYSGNAVINRYLTNLLSYVIILFMTQKLTDLVSSIEEAQHAYYNTCNAKWTDAEYDLMIEELREIDPNHPLIVKVGATPSAGVKKITHKIPMLSLNKVTTEKALTAFINKVGLPVVVEPKKDGMSVELKYVKGLYREASTRGDGVVGEDVTENMRKTGIPLKLKDPVDVEVRGEVVLPIEKFKAIGGKNPRNVGNGIMRRADGSQCELLCFYAFETTLLMETETDQLDWLEENGFDTVNAEVIYQIDDLISVLAEVGKSRPSLKFAIDGAVIKPYDLSISKRLGVTSGRPVGMAAWKWEDESHVTTVNNIVVSVGHTGLLAPTAMLEPIEIDGSEVSMAYLNNWNDIERLNVNIGDEVEVTKRNQIIPHIESVVVKHSVGFFPEPTVCPVCGSLTNRKEGVKGEEGAITFCGNGNCPARTSGKVKRWIDSLDIKGIGDELLAALTSDHPYGPLVSDPAGLYTLSTEDIEGLTVGNGRLGKSRAEAVINEIQSTRKITIDQFIGSLGVEFLGVRKVEQMRELAEGLLDTVEYWTNPGHLMSLAVKCKVPNSMERINQGIQQVAGTISNLLKEVTVQPVMKAQAKVVAKGDLTFTLTGKFEVPKADIHKKIEAAGHSWLADFTKETTYLVTASEDSTSSKAKKAIKAGVPVITLAQLEGIL